MSITIKEIADKAHVSIATVSRALNNDVKVKDSTKNLIQNLAVELNYRPNIPARNLVKRNTNIIGLVLPEIQGEFFTEIIRGVDELAYSGGYHVIVAGSHSQRNMFESIINFMGSSMVDGVIMMIPSINDEVKELLSKSQIPVVIINGKQEFDDFDSITIDNFQGAYSITDFLINNFGYSKIAMIKGPSSNNDALQRRKGYSAALRDNKIKENDEWIINGDFTIRSGELSAARLLSLKNKPQVIFAANDMMAAGCYRVIKSLGLKIPEDIGVVGFDHISLSEFMNPSLTTVHIPISEMGKTAIKLLLEKIQKKNLTVQHIKLSTGIIIGESCKKQN